MSDADDDDERRYARYEMPPRYDERALMIRLFAPMFRRDAAEPPPLRDEDERRRCRQRATPSEEFTMQ